MTLYLKGIKAKLTKTKKSINVEFAMQNIQLDNQSEIDPIYPVMLKPQDVTTLVRMEAIPGQDQPMPEEMLNH